jgi:hypothetical protein
MNDQNETQQDHDTLDALLFEFGQHIATQSQLTEPERLQLANRIVSEVSGPQTNIGYHKNNVVKRASFVAILSACLLLLVVVKSWQSTDKPNPIPGNTGPSTQLFAERHRDQMQAVAEHEQVFGLPLAWYVERGNQVRFELAGDEATTSKHRPVFAELRVEKIEGDTKARKSQGETLFLMTRGEQIIELDAAHSERPKLLFWLCPVDENLFAYELAMHENNGMSFSGETVGLIEADKLEQPLTLKQNGVEYHVYLQVNAST